MSIKIKKYLAAAALFGTVSSAAAIPLPTGPITMHFTNWETQVGAVGNALNGIFRVDQILDAGNNIVWSYGQGGEGLVGTFTGTVGFIDGGGVAPGNRVYFNAGTALNFQTILPGSFNPTFPGAWTAIDANWLNTVFTSGGAYDPTHPVAAGDPQAAHQYGLTSVIASIGADPDGILAIIGHGGGLMDAISGTVKTSFDTNTYARLGDGAAVIGMADMRVDNTFYLRTALGNPAKDGWPVWSKDPISANIPEPETLALMGIGLLGLVLTARIRKSGETNS